jgi:hypothetical protein
MSSSKKLTCNGTLRRCLSEFIDWIKYTLYSQSCWYFRPSFVNCCPSKFLSGSCSPLPPPPFPVWKSILCSTRLYIVYGGGGGGGGNGVSGPQTVKSAAKSLYRSFVLDDDFFFYRLLWVLSFYVLAYASSTWQWQYLYPRWWSEVFGSF